MSTTSLMLSSLQAITTTSSSSPHLLPKISHASQNARGRRAASRRGWRVGSFSIRSSSEKNGGEESPLLILDRRNMLLGLGGGLYGAATGLGRDQSAIANPIGPPDLSKCGIANSGEICYHCCPPYPIPPKLDDIPSYVIPQTEKPRVRMPAHKMTADQLSKFKAAIQAMKDLPETDPRNFFQQAQVHCAYCNEAYDQVGFDKNSDRQKNVALQVHFSWIFLPWHRWYLYFYEKILGSLIGDDTFALPYWNYDNQDGMKFPSIYTDCNSPLFDPLRNLTNCNPKDPKIVDLAGTGATSEEQLIKDNLAYLRTTFDENKGLPEAFIGDSVVAGEKIDEKTNADKSSGALENLHNGVHIWAGSSATPNFNMGNFVSAARDPVFFGHHANIDRLWQIYRTKVMKPKIETDSPDWLDATFIFFDENQKIVKVNVKDCLTNLSLGYDYQDMTPTWTQAKKSTATAAKTRSAAASKVPVAEFGPVPRILDESPIRALVNRPKSSRGASEAEENVEVLVIDGIEIEHSTPTRFNVYVTKPSGKFAGADYGQFAGSFVTAAHGHRHNEEEKKVKTLRVKLGITELIKDIDAETSESLVVTLVPIMSTAVIGGIHIEQVKSK